MGLMLARPTVCRGGGGSGPGFRGDFPAYAPARRLRGSHPPHLHRPFCLSDKDSAPGREQPARLVGWTRGAEGLISKGWPYLLWFRAWRRSVADWRVRPWRSRISCKRGRAECTRRNFVFFFSKIYQQRTYSPYVFKIKCVKTDEKQSVSGRICRSHGPTPDPPLQ